MHSPGVGLSHHFAGELLKQRANVDIQAVSYRGTAPALNDVIGGAVEMTFGTLAGRDGRDRRRPRSRRLRSRRRNAPKACPTSRQWPNWASRVSMSANGSVLWLPPTRRHAVVTRVNAETNAVLLDPELQLWLKQNNVVRGTTTPDGFRNSSPTKSRSFRQIAAKAGISVE